MTSLLLLLVLVLALGGCLTLVLGRLLRPADTLGEDLLATAFGSTPEVYRPLERLFATQDFDFLATFGERRPDLRQRLRRERRRVLLLYLAELRADFTRLYGLCRLLAPRSQDPGFASRVTRQALAFYGLWALVCAGCWLGWFGHARTFSFELIGAFERLRQAARATLPAAAGALQPAAQRA